MSLKSPLMPKTQPDKRELCCFFGKVFTGGWSENWRPGISRRDRRPTVLSFFLLAAFPVAPVAFGTFAFGSFSFNGLIPAAVYHNFFDLLSANSNNNNHNSNKNNGHGGKIKIK